MVESSYLSVKLLQDVFSCMASILATSSCAPNRQSPSASFYISSQMWKGALGIALTDAVPEHDIIKGLRRMLVVEWVAVF